MKMRKGFEQVFNVTYKFLILLHVWRTPDYLWLNFLLCGKSAESKWVTVGGGQSLLHAIRIPSSNFLLSKKPRLTFTQPTPIPHFLFMSFKTRDLAGTAVQREWNQYLMCWSQNNKKDIFLSYLCIARCSAPR